MAPELGQIIFKNFIINVNMVYKVTGGDGLFQVGSYLGRFVPFKKKFNKYFKDLTLAPLFKNFYIKRN